MKRPLSISSFTLVELLIVIGILAILTAAVVIILNPAELLKQGRDSQRMQDLTAVDKALSLLTTQTPDISLGTASTVYISIPDTSATCANLGLPSLPSGYAYNCVTAANLRNTTGTGWIPVNFQSSGISALPTLPVDPVNTTSTNNYYTYSMGGSWELNTIFESAKYRPQYSRDGGDNFSQYEKGTSLSLSPFNDQGLAGYWAFDDGTGTDAKDSSSNANTGVIYGATWLTEGNCKMEKCLGFDGNDYVHIATSVPLMPSGSVSISVWLKHTSSQPYDVALGITDSGSNGYRIYANTTNIYFSVNGYTANVSQTSLVPDNVWRHVVGVYNQTAGTVTLYVNGLAANSDVFSGNITYTNTLARIGHHPNWHYWHGMLDDVRIYNRALSASEIQAIYNATK